MKFSLDGFKKVSKQGDLTTLKHPLGHTVTIKHSILSPKMRGEIEALPPADKESAPDAKSLNGDKIPKFAEGGQTQKPTPIPEDIEEYNKANPESPYDPEKQNKRDPASGYAKGGKIQKFAEGSDEPVKIDTSNDGIKPTDSQDIGMVKDRSDEGLRLPSDIALPKEEQAAEQSSNDDTKNQIAQEADSGDNTLPVQESQQPVDATQHMLDAHKNAMDAHNTAMQLFAQSQQKPQQNPQQPQLEQPQQSGAASRMAQGPSIPRDPTKFDPYALTQGNESAAEHGIQQEANAKGEIGNLNAQSAHNAAAQQQQIFDTAQKEHQNLMGEVNNVVDDIKNNKIDPKHWQNTENSTLGQKSKNMFALILGGIGSGIKGGSNPALDMINKHINDDLEAQKANQQSRQNLMSGLNNTMQNSDHAAEMFKAIQAENFARELDENMNKFASPIAQAQGAQLSAQLKQQAINGLAPVALQRAVLSQGNKIPLSTRIQYGLPESERAEAQKQASEYDSYQKTVQNVNNIMDQMNKEQTTSNLTNPQSYKRNSQNKAQLVQAIMETSPSKRLTRESVEEEIRPFEFGTGATQKTRDEARQKILDLVKTHAGPTNILEDHGLIPKVAPTGIQAPEGAKGKDRSGNTVIRRNGQWVRQ